MDQLDALAGIVSTFDASGIEYWLFGGWAVDFHAGRITRAHDDLDLGIWLDDISRIEALLNQEGWLDLNDPDVDGGRAFGRNGVRLELTYLRRDPDGEVYTPLLDGTRGRWTSEALGDDVAELAGVRCRVVSLVSLVRMKERDRGDAYEAKDRADAALLAELRGGGAV
jgi:hypothetical protein